MGATGPETVAFSRPGGEACPPSCARPIDLAHLAKQTMGDRNLEREVLELFAQQAAEVREKIGSAELEERRALSHTLKGSAKGIGAVAIAQCAAQIEADPCDTNAIARLDGLVDEVRDFIAAINR